MTKTLFLSDSKALHKRIHALSMDHGLDIIPTRTPDEARVAFRKQQPKIAIIDTNIAEKSGLDIAKEFVMEETDTRIIIITNIDTNEIRKLAIRSGARDLLIKPFSDEDFLFTLNLYLSDVGDSK